MIKYFLNIRGKVSIYTSLLPKKGPEMLSSRYLLSFSLLALQSAGQIYKMFA